MVLSRPALRSMRLLACTHLAFPRVSHSLSEDELDEAELAVRLTLNNLHADAGEQLDVVRTPNAIQVKGIVETDQRKREIEFHLHTLPNVISAIFTVEEMEHRMASAANATSVCSNLTNHAAVAFGVLSQ